MMKDQVTIVGCQKKEINIQLEEKGKICFKSWHAVCKLNHWQVGEQFKLESLNLEKIEAYTFLTNFISLIDK